MRKASEMLGESKITPELPYGKCPYAASYSICYPAPLMEKGRG